MHQALILIARAIALAHDHWRRSVGRRLSLSGHVAVLEERVRLSLPKIKHTGGKAPFAGGFLNPTR